MKRLWSVLAVLILLLIQGAVLPAAAQTGELAVAVDGGHRRLTDGSFATYEQVKNTLTVIADRPIQGLYLLFWQDTAAFTVTNGENTLRFEEDFLQYYADVAQLNAPQLTITFEESAVISEIRAFGEGPLPDDVHDWNAPHDKADLLLLSTHADDEQLFFAGVMPYYAGEKGLRVQVAYFTNHRAQPVRQQELLDGLWTVGIRHYPVISAFPDAYSESYDGALRNFKEAGYTEDDLLRVQVELIRRFDPLVIVGHDLKGEYGHGQHIANAVLLTRAVEEAAQATCFAASAEQYGTWNTPKLYLHLYEENALTMNWDVPLTRFDGKTAFQVSQEGFQCHDSQQYTWFRRWLNGNDGSNTTAASIATYSPCEYGLYRSMVGLDEEKNDFFEHLLTYDEQAAWEQNRQPADTVPDQDSVEEHPAFPVTEGIALLAAAAVTGIFFICKKR